MKLILTSTGLASIKLSKIFLSKLNKSPSSCKVLMIAYASNEEVIYFRKMCEDEMNNLGFLDITFVNLNDDIIMDASINFDVVYVCGGNTFSILNKIKILKLDKYIINLIKNGAFYVGVSAGSIIAGPNIIVAEWGSDPDINNVGLLDLNGLGLVPFAVNPHYIKGEEGPLANNSKEINYKVISITNDQAVLVDGDSYKVVSW